VFDSHVNHPMAIFYEGVIFFLGWKTVEVGWEWCRRWLYRHGYLKRTEPIWPNRKRKP
jgi:hypothetical protein